MPRYFDVIPGRGCNFRCKYCFEAKSPTAYAAKCMPTSVVDVSAEYIRKASGLCDSARLVFYGGEPLLYTDVIQRFADKLQDFEAPFVVITNGMLISQNSDWLSSLGKQRKLHVTVSYDYCLQDEMRHHGSYQAVRDNIIWLHKNNLLYNVIATFTLGSLSRLSDVFSDFLRLRHSVPQLNLMFNIDRHTAPEEYDDNAFVNALKGIRSYLERTGGWGLVHPNNWTYRRNRECSDGWICSVHSGIDVDGSVYPAYNIALHNDTHRNLLRFGSVFDSFEDIMAARLRILNATNWELPEQCKKCDNWCRENVWRSISTSLSEASGFPGELHCRIFGLLTKYLRP